MATGWSEAMELPGRNLLDEGDGGVLGWQVQKPVGISDGDGGGAHFGSALVVWVLSLSQLSSVML